MKNYTLIATIVLLVSFTLQRDLPKSAYKKIDKTISELWPGKTITREAVVVAKEKLTALNITLQKDDLFKLKDGSSLAGYMYIADAPSKYERFDYMVIFKPDLTILQPRLLVYRENYGAEIGNKRWLRQFVGKKNGEGMTFSKDIQGLSGATISAKSITKGISELSKNIKKLKDNNLL